MLGQQTAASASLQLDAITQYSSPLWITIKRSILRSPCPYIRWSNKLTEISLIWIYTLLFYIKFMVINQTLPKLHFGENLQIMYKIV